jgi:peroxiredoxin (alkyl hydroperoxide reductase subunit C)
VDRLNVVTPEGWQPGERTVAPPPDTVAGVDATRDDALGCVDWYYQERQERQP